MISSDQLCALSQWQLRIPHNQMLRREGPPQRTHIQVQFGGLEIIAQSLGVSMCIANYFVYVLIGPRSSCLNIFHVLALLALKTHGQEFWRSSLLAISNTLSCQCVISAYHEPISDGQERILLKPIKIKETSRGQNSVLNRSSDQTKPSKAFCFSLSNNFYTTLTFLSP